MRSTLAPSSPQPTGSSKAIIDIETGQRGFVITGKGRFLEPWRAGREAFPPWAEMLIELADTPAGKARARRIADAGKSYIRDYSIPLVQAARRSERAKHRGDAAGQGPRGRPPLPVGSPHLRGPRDAHTRRQEAADDDAERAITIATIGLLGSIVLCCSAGRTGSARARRPDSPYVLDGGPAGRG